MQRATCYPGLSGEACTEGPANPETEATAQDGLSMKSLTRAGRGSRWSRPRPHVLWLPQQRPLLMSRESVCLRASQVTLEHQSDIPEGTAAGSGAQTTDPSL